jgi:hypothetical protein
MTKESLGVQGQWDLHTVLPCVAGLTDPRSSHPGIGRIKAQVGVCAARP